MCTPERLSKLYMNVVTGMNDIGSIRVDDDGAVIARFGEHLVLVFHNHAPSDPEFLHVTCTFRTGEDDPIRLAEACAKVNARVKGATLIKNGVETIVCSVEMVLAGVSCMPSQEVLAGVLPRIVNMINHAISELLTEIALRGILAATESA